MEQRIGRYFKVFFDDGVKVVWKEGKVTSEDDDFLTVNNDVIAKSRIIRMEPIIDG